MVVELGNSGGLATLCCKSIGLMTSSVVLSGILTYSIDYKSLYKIER